MPAARAPRGRGAARAARRLWPIALAAYERWQSLPESEKEKYRARVRQIAARSQKTLEQRRKRRR